MLLSHVFFLVFAQSTALLFKKWWLSLAYFVGYTMLVQWVFHPYLPDPTVSLAMQVWVYRFLPALMGWAVSAWTIELLYPLRVTYPPVVGIGVPQAVTLFGVLEAVMVHVAMLPAMLSSSASAIGLSLFFMTLHWIIYFASHYSVIWRFLCSAESVRFYCVYYGPTVLITMLTMILGVTFTGDTNEYSETRFILSFIAATLSSLYLFFAWLLKQVRDQAQEQQKRRS